MSEIKPPIMEKCPKPFKIGCSNIKQYSQPSKKGHPKAEKCFALSEIRGLKIKLCLVSYTTTGLSIWETSSAAKYNDYVIYDTPTGEAQLYQRYR